MKHRTLVRDNVGHLSADNRTDNHPPLGGVVRCLVRRPSQRQIKRTRAALKAMLLGPERLPFDDDVSIESAQAQPGGLSLIRWIRPKPVGIAFFRTGKFRLRHSA
jgi:hypothetical protein